jgi:lysophospholipase L1-like esterase
VRKLILPFIRIFRKTFLVSLLAIILTLLITELGLRLYLREPDRQTRLIFFSEGEVFKNKDWGGFVYQPNVTIRSTVFYVSNGDISTLTKEFENDITTNSLGLVQLKQIDPLKPAILFLGDSFTEGHGASPWFYELERRWPETLRQIINGGILGTGVEAWGRLYDDLSRHIKIDRIVIVFTSQDWTWPVWQLSKGALDCLKAHLLCSGHEDFFSLPASSLSTEQYVQKIARSRFEYDQQKTRDGNLLERSFIFSRILRPTYRTVHKIFARADNASADDKQFEISENTIIRIVGSIGHDHVLFIHLPMKDEIPLGPNQLGTRAREFLSQHKLTLVDGFSNCGLTLKDFHRTDNHPNQDGYRKIADCVERNVKATLYGS